MRLGTWRAARHDRAGPQEAVRYGRSDMTVSEFSAVVTDIRSGVARWRVGALADDAGPHGICRGRRGRATCRLARRNAHRGAGACGRRGRGGRSVACGGEAAGRGNRRCRPSHEVKTASVAASTNSLLTTTPYPPSPPIGKIAKIMHLQRFTAMIVEPNGLVLKCKILLSLFAAS